MTKLNITLAALCVITFLLTRNHGLKTENKLLYEAKNKAELKAMKLTRRVDILEKGTGHLLMIEVLKPIQDSVQQKLQAEYDLLTSGDTAVIHDRYYSGENIGGGN